MSDFQPTTRLRFVKRLQDAGNGRTRERFVLQQQWQSLGAPNYPPSDPKEPPQTEWRDVPLEEAQ